MEAGLQAPVLCFLQRPRMDASQTHRLSEPA